MHRFRRGPPRSKKPKPVRKWSPESLAREDGRGAEKPIAMWGGNLEAGSSSHLLTALRIAVMTFVRGMSGYTSLSDRGSPERHSTLCGNDPLNGSTRPVGSSGSERAGTDGD